MRPNFKKNASIKTQKSPKNATKIRKNATKTTKKCGQCPKNAFNASILFQKSSKCKKCFFNAGTIARCLVPTEYFFAQNPEPDFAFDSYCILPPPNYHATLTFQRIMTTNCTVFCIGIVRSVAVTPSSSTSLMYGNSE